ncbi:GtrA family protein [Streptomyces sp. NPDC093600]|uniref:GtrA family protein n=1 Tax=Streptomyces sp. NPDC093600 TaxID=3366047 RepID=UPI00381AC96E
MTVTWQVVRFALVGLVNTATYYGLYLLFMRAMPYLAAHVAAFLLSMVGSFFLTSYFTYRTRPTWRKFLLFPLTNAANFVITTVGIYLMVDIAGLDSRYAPLLAAAAAVPVTFLVSRTIMLRPDTTRTRESLTETVASK